MNESDPLSRAGEAKPDVRRLGLGLAALGRPGYINLGHGEDLGGRTGPEAMRRHTAHMLDAAFAAGIRYFDCARSHGRAEEFLAGWIRSRGRGPGEVMVASKWGYRYTAGWQIEAEHHEIKEHSQSMLERQWSESQAFLGSHLNIYQIHSATRESGVLRNAQVLDYLRQLREHGLLIGLSVSGPGQADVIREALEVRADAELLFGAVQATFNLLEPSAGKALQEAANAGWRVIVKEALANGRLTARNAGNGDDNPVGMLKIRAREIGTTPDALALAWVFSKPWVSTLLLGAATEEQLRSNLGCLDVTPTALDASGYGLAEVPEAYWERRKRLAWN